MARRYTLESLDLVGIEYVPDAHVSLDYQGSPTAQELENEILSGIHTNQDGTIGCLLCGCVDMFYREFNTKGRRYRCMSCFYNSEAQFESVKSQKDITLSSYGLVYVCDICGEEMDSYNKATVLRHLKKHEDANKVLDAEYTFKPPTGYENTGGWFQPETDQVYINLSNQGFRDDALEDKYTGLFDTLAHEYGHKETLQDVTDYYQEKYEKGGSPSQGPRPYGSSRTLNPQLSPLMAEYNYAVEFAAFMVQTEGDFERSRVLAVLHPACFMHILTQLPYDTDHEGAFISDETLEEFFSTLDIESNRDLLTKAQRIITYPDIPEQHKEFMTHFLDYANKSFEAEGEEALYWASRTNMCEAEDYEIRRWLKVLRDDDPDWDDIDWEDDAPYDDGWHDDIDWQAENYFPYPLRDNSPRKSAAVLFVTNDGLVGLGLRSFRLRAGNTWAAIGGFSERGETPVQTIYREVYEELGIRLPNRVEWLGSDGLHEVYLCRINKPFKNYRLNWEHTDFAWKTLGEWKKQRIHPQLLPLLGNKTFLADAHITNVVEGCAHDKYKYGGILQPGQHGISPEDYEKILEQQHSAYAKNKEKWDFEDTLPSKPYADYTPNDPIGIANKRRLRQGGLFLNWLKTFSVGLEGYKRQCIFFGIIPVKDTPPTRAGRPNPLDPYLPYIPDKKEYTPWEKPPDQNPWDKSPSDYKPKRPWEEYE